MREYAKAKRENFTEADLKRKNEWGRAYRERLALDKDSERYLHSVEKRKEIKRKNLKELSDGYVRSLLAQGKQAKAADIPDSLVAIKREVLLAKRALVAVISDGEKFCNACNEIHPKSEFYSSRVNGKMVYTAVCKKQFLINCKNRHNAEMIINPNKNREHYQQYKHRQSEVEKLKRKAEWAAKPIEERRSINRKNKKECVDETI
jgi:hypothetical protein